MQQEIETILSVSHHPRWPRQEQWCVSLVAVAGIIAINFAMEKRLYIEESFITFAPDETAREGQD